MVACETEDVFENVLDAFDLVLDIWVKSDLKPTLVRGEQGHILFMGVVYSIQKETKIFPFTHHNSILLFDVAKFKKNPKNYVLNH